MAKDYVEDMECDAKLPLDYTWNSVNNFVFNPDVAFEDLQSLCLGLAAKLETAQQLHQADDTCSLCGYDRGRHLSTCANWR